MLLLKQKNLQDNQFSKKLYLTIYNLQIIVIMILIKFSLRIERNVKAGETIAVEENEIKPKEISSLDKVFSQ